MIRRSSICRSILAVLLAIAAFATPAHAEPSDDLNDVELLVSLSENPADSAQIDAAIRRSFVQGLGPGVAFGFPYAQEYGLTRRGEPVRDELRRAALAVARSLPDVAEEWPGRDATRRWTEQALMAAADGNDDRVVEYLRERLRVYMPRVEHEDWVERDWAREVIQQLLATLAEYGLASAGALPEAMLITQFGDPIKGVILRDDLVNLFAAMGPLAQPALPWLDAWSGDAHAKWAAILVRAEETDPMSAVLVLMNDPFWRIRRGAISVARREHMLHPKIVAGILRLLREDESELVRVAAASELIGLNEHIDEVHSVMLDVSAPDAYAYRRAHILRSAGLDASPLLPKLRQEQAERIDNPTVRHNYDRVIELAKKSVEDPSPGKSLGSKRKYWGDYTSAP